MSLNQLLSDIEKPWLNVRVNNLTVDNNLNANGQIDGDLTVTGNTDLGGTLDVTSNAIVGGTLDVTGITGCNTIQLANEFNIPSGYIVPIVGSAATINSIGGILQDSGVVNSGNRAPIIVSNNKVKTDSIVLVTCTGANTIADYSALSVSTAPSNGAFTLYVRNNDPVNATSISPEYHYFIINSY